MNILGTWNLSRMRMVVALTVAAVLPRLPVVASGFSVDDPLLVEHAGASGGLISAVVEAWPPGVYRPLVTLHFDLCRALFGEWAPGYHLVSILLHLVVVWLVFLLCSKIGVSGWPALCAALTFALLPAANEAIAWAASVGDLWAAGFVICAVLLALEAVKSESAASHGLWLGSMAAMVAGCAAKETALVAALLVPVAAWVFGRRRPNWGSIAAYPAIAVAYLVWHGSRVAGPGVIAMLGSPWRCLVRTVQNIVMTIVPFGRNTVGDWLWSGQGMTRVVTVSTVVALGVLVVFALRRDDRVAVFGWLWATVAFLPVCRMPWAERYAYLPAVGLALVGVAALNRVRGRGAPAVSTAVAAILIAFAVGSVLSANGWTRRVGRYLRTQNRSTAAAQWKPAPNAVSNTRSPGLIRPC